MRKSSAVYSSSMTTALKTVKSVTNSVSMLTTEELRSSVETFVPVSACEQNFVAIAYVCL